MEKLAFGLLLAIVAFFVFASGFELGTTIMRKEAFEHNFMTKEIGKNDKVIYRWVEPHKVGFDYSE